MSEDNLNITATFSAHDAMSPVLQKLLANLKKFEDAAKRINASFTSMGSSGVASMTNFDQVTQAAAASMSSFAAGNRAASRSVSEGWRRASDQRLRDARTLYGSLEMMEATYQRQMRTRTSAGARQPHGGGGSARGYGGIPRLPAPSVRTLAIGGTIAGVGIGSAIKKRMEVDAAETRAAMFGELSKADIGSLRGGFADRAGIKYGVGTGKVIDAATEGLKAGIAKQYAGEFADLALKAQAGLDVSSTDTAKLMGRLSTQMPWDKGRFNKILNAVAVANNETAADGSEIIEGMRRSLSALATTKMPPEQLAALNATGISLGIQPGKMGTALSFITSQMAGAGSAHGQQAKDLTSAAGSLGFGGRSGMAKAMRDDPTTAIQQMLNRLARMPEALRTKVAKQIGGREWMDEILTLVLGREKLSDVLKQIEAKPDFLDRTALTKVKSMSGRWASVSAAFALVWEKVGGGFEETFDQITESIIDLAGSFSFETIKQHVSALTTGLREGFGLKSWGDAIRVLASSFNTGSMAKWREFGTGFAQGIGSFIAMVQGAFIGLASITGRGDPASMGKLVAQILGLSVALAVLSPVLGVLASLTTFLGAVALIGSSATLGIGALFVALSAGLKMSLSHVSDKIFSVFVGIVDAVQSVALAVINKVRGWVGLLPIGGGSSGKPRTGTPGASGSWGSPDQTPMEDGDLGKDHPVKKMNLQMERLGEKFDRFAGMIQKASLTGAGDLSSSSRQMASSSAPAGSKSDLINSAPGSFLPNLGGLRGPTIGRGGIDPDRIPSFTGGGGSTADKVGAGLSGSSFLTARRSRFGEEIKNDPALREQLAGMMITEGAQQPGPVIESLMNRQDMTGGSLKKGLFNGFYGPINRGELPAAVGRYRRDPKLKAKMDAAIDAALAGSHRIGGFTDQGLPTDPNGSQRGGRGREMMKLGGNEFLDWGAGRWNGRRGHAGSEAYRRFIEKGIAGDGASFPPTASVPASPNAIQNVPAKSVIDNVPVPVSARGGGGAGGFSGASGGPISININGGSHDAEGLANKVQERMREAMNWRTHDMDVEST